MRYPTQLFAEGGHHRRGAQRVHLFRTPVYGQSQAPSTGKVIGANARINVAYVGAGDQGFTHIRYQKRDASDNNIARDYRILLERKDVDAVVVATPDHSHAQVTLDALAAGKHVYCEKPMTRYLAEAFEVYDAVRQSGKTYVIGTQGCMDPKWDKAAEWIKGRQARPVGVGPELLLPQQCEKQRVDLPHRSGRQRADPRLESLAGPCAQGTF